MSVKTLDEIEGLNRLNTNAKAAVLRAYDIARYELVQKGDTNIVTSEHLFAGILMEKQSVAVKALTRLHVDTDKLMQNLLKQRTSKPLKVQPAKDFNEVIYGAFFEANRLGHVYVGSEHLLLSLFKQKKLKDINDIIQQGTTYQMLRNIVMSVGNYHPGIFSSMPSDMKENNGALEYFTRDMNQMAKDGKFLPIFGRYDEIDRMIHILSRKNKNNPVLIGDAGVGKTAIVEGFVQRILSGDVPDALAKYKVIQLDLAVILAGAKIRGDVEERLLAIIEELRKDKNKVVFIDEIHMIIGAGTAGSGGGMDIANLLKPHLTSGDIKVIGATTFDEYQRYFEEDNALTRRFQPITINEISEEDAIKLLGYVKEEYEKFHGINIGKEAIEEAVKLSARYITDRFLPDKALDLLDETAAKVKLAQKSILQKSTLTQHLDTIRKEKLRLLQEGDLVKAANKRIEEKKLTREISDERKKLSKRRKAISIHAEDVKEVVSKITGIPVTTMSKTDIESLKTLGKFFEEKIIGQDEAVENVSAALKRARVGLMDQNRPLASFLFLGPTGVGKTETAKVIAEYLFGDEKALLQVNMSEFMEQHSVSKIIGSPPGYVGYSEGGHITEKVRRKPYSVVLFDEIEKAHPDTLNILLQILDEGEIRDSKGRNVNFRNTIIIMTSNIGAEEIGDDAVLGFDMTNPDLVKETSGKQEEVAYKEMKKKLMVELKEEMRPEFLNRIDEIVIFRGLDKNDARGITRLLFGVLNNRLEKFGIKVDYSRKVLNYIVDQGFSEEYGARNLRRKIQELIETKLSEMMLNKDFGMSKKEGSDQKIRTIGIDVSKEKDGDKDNGSNNDELVFKI